MKARRWEKLGHLIRSNAPAWMGLFKVMQCKRKKLGCAPANLTNILKCNLKQIAKAGGTTGSAEGQVAEIVPGMAKATYFKFAMHAIFMQYINICIKGIRSL